MLLRIGMDDSIKMRSNALEKSESSGQFVAQRQSFLPQSRSRLRTWRLHSLRSQAVVPTHRVPISQMTTFSVLIGFLMRDKHPVGSKLCSAGRSVSILCQSSNPATRRSMDQKVVSKNTVFSVGTIAHGLIFSLETLPLPFNSISSSGSPQNVFA